MAKELVEPTEIAEWLPLLTFRPPLDRGYKRVLVSDPIYSKRAYVEIPALTDLLGWMHQGGQTVLADSAASLLGRLKELGWVGGALEGATARKIRHWWRRGWHPSLSYYLWTRHSPYVDLNDDTGENRRSAVRSFLDADGPPPPRIYPKGARLPLPEPKAISDDAILGELLLRRRTVRGFISTGTSEAVLSSILHIGLEDVRQRRKEPRDGLEYLKSYGIAFDVYLVSYRVDGIPAGAYLYEMLGHYLIEVRRGDLRKRMSSILLGMPAPKTAAWTIVLTADFAQYQWRYRHERALRNLYIASGRIAQRLIVVGLAHALGTLPTPATRDRDLCDVLRLDKYRQAPIYTLTMGPYKSSLTRHSGEYAPDHH